MLGTGAGDPCQTGCAITVGIETADSAGQPSSVAVGTQAFTQVLPGSYTTITFTFATPLQLASSTK